MNSTYKFTYFNFMGIGEPIRYMFAYTGVNYEHTIVNYKTNWPTMKKTIPFGRLPVLEVDGKVLCHPQAIARYLAKKFNLYSTDDWTTAQMDAVAESLYFFWFKLTEYYRETDTTRKTLYKKTMETEYCPMFLTQYEKMVETNNGFFTGKLSWVDFWFVGIMDSMICMWGTDFLKGKYTHLYQLYQKIQTLPSIKTYLSKRPTYDF